MLGQIASPKGVLTFGDGLPRMPQYMDVVHGKRNTPRPVKGDLSNGPQSHDIMDLGDIRHVFDRQIVQANRIHVNEKAPEKKGYLLRIAAHSVECWHWPERIGE